MHTVGRLMGGLVVVCVASGCRTATRVVEEPRVDLEVSGGNRGYLVGKPPTVSASRKTTRQMVETEIEVPALSRSGPIGGGTAQPGKTSSVGPAPVAPSEGRHVTEEGREPDLGQPETFQTYVVKKGDTLWSIAADPKVFGDATKWRQLFAANRETLKSPDRLRAGMMLRVPRRSGSAKPSGTGKEPSSEDTIFSK